jgi:hypothetical protein
MSVFPDARFDARDEDAAYRQWIASHPEGYVLNWPKAGKPGEKVRVVYHRATCLGLKATKTIPAWVKICVLGFDRLDQWIKENDIQPGSSGVHPCKDCFKGGREEVENELRKARGDTPPAVDADVPERVPTMILRIVRDTALARRIKSLHDGECQLCGTVIDLPGGGRYAEAHHLQPLGKPHDGPDHEGDLVCVCPTCHAKLDYGVVQLRFEELRRAEGHQVSREFLDYHNRTVYRGKRHDGGDARHPPAR